MKRIVALFFFLTAALCAQPAVLDLGREGKLTVYLPDGFTASSSDMAGTAAMTIKPTGSENVMCTLTVSRPEKDRFDAKNMLKTRVEADGYNIAQGSVEGKAYAKEFKLSMPGFGYYCNFTDATMVDRKPKEGEFKVMTMGKIRPGPQIMIDVTIMANDFRSSDYNSIFGAIEGMEYTPKK